MALEEIKQNLSDVQDNAQSYLELSEDYYYLKSFKIAMSLVTSFAQLLLVGAFTLAALFILGLAASFGLGQVLESTFLGFLVVGTFVLIIAIIAYFMRKKINKPIIRKFSKPYFDMS